jgi:hypothetical protein
VCCDESSKEKAEEEQKLFVETQLISMDVGYQAGQIDETVEPF